MGKSQLGRCNVFVNHIWDVVEQKLLGLFACVYSRTHARKSRQQMATELRELRRRLGPRIGPHVGATAPAQGLCPPKPKSLDQPK